MKTLIIVGLVVYILLSNVVFFICGYKSGLNDLTGIIDKKIKEIQEDEQRNSSENQPDEGIEG